MRKANSIFARKKKLIMRKHLLALLGIIPLAAVSAPVQDNILETSAEGYLERGIRMYDTKNYTGCIDQLGEAKRMEAPASLHEDADFYIASAKFRRGDSDCLKAMLTFVEDYPASIHRFQMWFNIGNYYYENGEYKEAVTAYGNVGKESFSGNDMDDLTYRRSFCYLRLAEYDKARAGFSRLKGSKEYGEASAFYDAYISYANGDYGKAETGFKSIPQRSRLWNEAQYYICQIRFEDADYDNALRIGNRLLSEKFPKDMDTELRRVVGESEYHLGNYERAVDLLKQYADNCSGEPERSSLYILGIAGYRNGDNGEAVRYLDKVVGEDDALAQSAYLYIGQTYLRSGNVNAASLAFEKAYKMPYDKSVQETAFYNYAIAQSRGGSVPFSNSVKIFEDFLNRFPDSKYASDVEDYIINSYLASKDYDNALSSISALENPSDKMLAAKQNVLYRLGVRELSAGNTGDALDYFTRSSQLRKYDSKIANENALWLAEAAYRNGDYAKAADSYSSYLKRANSKDANYALANYGYGYSLFQQRKYSEAKAAFTKFLNQNPTDKAMKTDAYNRIGDCLYYNKNYSEAEGYYEKAIGIEGVKADYSLFQKGFMLGLQRRHKEKISVMDKVIDNFPSSVYAPKALYEKAQAYIALGDNGKAEATFSKLMGDYPQSAEARQGQLQLAMLLNGTGRKDEARDQYKSLISKSPSSDEAKVAIEDLKVMYASEGDIAGFTAFIRNVDSSYKVDGGEMDRLSFQSAENAYLAGDGTAKLESYLKSYPDGQYSGQANYYLAENAYKKKAYSKALGLLEKALAAAPDASYAETALVMEGEILLSQNKISEARDAYVVLRSKATTDASRQSALLGLFRVSRDSGKEDDVLTYANMLVSQQLDAETRAEVLYGRASVLASQGKKSEAMDDYKQLAKDPQSLYGAIAAVELSQIYYDEGKLDSAEKQLNKLIDSGTPHQYWMARGFILLSDVYKKRGDTFQAREYLESLRENYPGKEADIQEMIETRLKALKNK